MSIIHRTPYADGYRLVVPTPRGEGLADRLDVYADRRAAMVWPGPTWRGYACVCALDDAPTVYGQRRLVLLDEVEDDADERIYKWLAVGCKLYQCQTVLADCSGHELKEAAFARWAYRTAPGVMILADASEYATIAGATATIDARQRAGTISIKDGPVMRQQAGVIRPDDVTHQQVDGMTPEQRYPALAALAMIVMSYEVSPWVKPRIDESRSRRGGYG